MSKVLLQPAGDINAREHYVDTIENPVSIDRIGNFVKGNELNVLNDLYTDGKVYVWGVTPGTNGININKWNRIESGDTCLFSRGGEIFASGVVTFKLQNKNLAIDLWNTDEKGNTWEYIFFVDEIKNHSIPYAYFNRVVGYKENFVIQGFNVLDEAKSNAIFNEFNLRSGIHLPPIDKDEHQEIRDYLTGDNNEKVETYRRKEQEYLKSSLFGYKKQIECGICNKTFNKDMVWCSHIKKRRYCTNEEQVNLNVVMPMCKFGCDDLFEKGYLTVSEGSVIILNNVQAML